MIRCSASALLLILAAAVMGCGKPPVREHHFTGPIMGTFYNVKVVASLSERSAAKLDQTLREILEAVDNKMSTWKPESELSRFNNHQSTDPFKLSKETLQVFEIARQVSEQTRGAFDVTIGPIVNAYGFGPDQSRADGPSEEEITALLTRVGFEKLHLDLQTQTIAKQDPNLYCDLSGVAKGYSVDAVAEALNDMGHERYMIEVGGEVRARGTNFRGSAWQIAIEKPVSDAREIEMILPISELAMATSGDYRNYQEMDGRRITHLIDTRTGRPIDNKLASVTVLHPSCAWADAYATAIAVLGPEEGMALARERAIAIFMIVHDGESDFVELSSPIFEMFVTPQPIM